MLWLFIRKLFMKGASLEEGIQAFIKANKGMTKSDGQKLINVFQDVKKNTATVTDLGKYKKDKGIASLSVDEQFTSPFQRTTPRIQQDKTLLKDSPEAIAKIKAENKAAAERLRKKKLDEEPDDLASGGRIGMAIGGFTKAQVLIQMIKNTLKGSKDPYVKKTFPNFIKELTKNPELANDPNVWKQFTTGLPKNQRLVVHSDDSVDFFTQSEFGPHNIEKTLEFQKKHNLSRDQASKILKMEPEDRVLEMKRLETIRNRTKQASGGIAGQLHLNDGGRVSFTKGGKVSSGLAHVLGV